MILSALVFSGNNAYAQNILKMDIVRTSQRFAIWVQKQAENFEQAMKEIAESQFGTFIGKGIDAAKKGLQFVKDKLQQAKELYGKVKDKINEIKESTAYKVALLSKQMAAETLVLDTIKKQRDTEKATIASDAELERINLEEKLKIAKENLEIGTEILKGELEELTTDEEKEIKQKEIDAYIEESTASINKLETEIANVEENKKSKLKELDFNFGLMVASQTAVIAEIGVEIADLIAQSKRENGEVEEDPEKLIEDAVNDFSYKEGEVVTLEDREKKDKTRRRKRENVSLAANSFASKIIAKTEDKIEEEAQNSGTSEITNGKSEALQTAISQTVVQLETLYEHLLLEIKALEFETANIMADNKEYKAGKIEAAIDICSYKMEKEKNLLDALKDAKSKAENVANKVQEGVNKATKVVNDVSGAVSDVVATAATVTSAVTSVAGAVENVKSGSIDKDTISGLTGM